MTLERFVWRGDVKRAFFVLMKWTNRALGFAGFLEWEEGHFFLRFLDSGKLDPRLAFGGLEKSWFPKSGFDWEPLPPADLMLFKRAQLLSPVGLIRISSSPTVRRCTCRLPYDASDRNFIPQRDMTRYSNRTRVYSCNGTTVCGALCWPISYHSVRGWCCFRLTFRLKSD
jgi:hypothetical protein